jgi:hypothetical protein
MICEGNIEDHCCWVAGEVCEFLQENTVPGRRWACGLLVKYGDWESVYIATEYDSVRTKFMDIKFDDDMRCGDWPALGVKCNACGKINDGSN